MKISIITPSYNHAEFLEKTLVSVLSQKGSFELEYIMMYEDSKSGSSFLDQFRQDLEVAKKYGKGYKWSLFLHNFNYYKIIVIYGLMRLFRRKK